MGERRIDIQSLTSGGNCSSVPDHGDLVALVRKSRLIYINRDWSTIPGAYLTPEASRILSEHHLVCGKFRRRASLSLFPLHFKLYGHLS